MRKRWNAMPEQIRERWRTAGLLLLLAPFFKPGYVSVCAPEAGVVYNAGRCISSLVVLWMAAGMFIRERRLSRAAVALIALEGWMSVDVLLHQGVNKAAFPGIISVLVVCMLIETASRRHAGALLSAFLLLYEVLIVLNFMSMLLWPGGLYYTPMQGMDNWFIGYRNMFVFYFLPALSLELVNRMRTGRCIRFYAMLAVCLISMAMSGSATGFVCILLFAGLSLTGLYKWKGINGLTAAAAWIISFFAITVLKIQNLLTPLLTALGRNATFTGRTGIWENTLVAISESPLFGYGIPDEATRTQVTKNSVGITAHNFIFEQLYCFGIVGLVLAALFLGIVVYTLYKNRNRLYAGALCIGMGCFFVVMLFEGELNNIPFLSFFLMCGLVDRMLAQIPAQIEEKSAQGQT